MTYCEYTLIVKVGNVYLGVSNYYFSILKFLSIFHFPKYSISSLVTVSRQGKPVDCGQTVREYLSSWKSVDLWIWPSAIGSNKNL